MSTAYVKVILSTRLENEWAAIVAVPEDRPGHYALSDFLTALKAAIGNKEYSRNTISDAIDISREEAEKFWLAA
jgi:hypothetical protein